MAFRIPFKKMSVWQLKLFSLCLIERMLPNYQLFSESAEFGDVRVLKNVTGLIWQQLDKNQKIKVNVEAQLAKVEEQIPEPEQFDFFAVYPALDTAMAVVSLLQFCSDKDGENIGHISQLSQGSVENYVSLLLAQEFDEVEEDVLVEHPLMVWEKETQNELFDFIAAAPENNQTIKAAKKMVLSEGVSSLGIELN